MFGRSRHDRLFARFAATGDVHALGEVFDATAPELVRVAAHLLGDREQARDLVQSAFLIVMERRSEFAVERRVLPWLVGIVANLARSERRRRSRVLERQAPLAEPDPAMAAEAVELRAALARAKAALPEVYRPLIDLHLEQGLTAVEIGDALGRPVGTVRTQIVRALEGLRQRLPRGLATGVIVWSLADLDLRAARVTVLERAAVSAPAGSVVGGVSWTLMGASVMHKRVLITAAFGLFFAALTAWAALSFGWIGGETEIDATWVVRPAGPERLQAATVGGAAERPERTAVPGTITTGGLEVLAKWRSDGAPARAIAIDVIYPGEVLGELNPRRVVTDALGCARFVDLPAGAVSVQTSTGVRRDAEVRSGAVHTVALELEGTGVRGQVVDSGGRPVADADVWVSSELRYTAASPGAMPGHGQYGEVVLRTDAQGEFTTRLVPLQCLAAAKVGYGVSMTVYPLRGLRPTEGQEVSVVLRLRQAVGTLAMTVRDPRGQPVRRALVLAGEETPYLTGEENLATPPARRVLTDDEGRATLTSLLAGRVPVVVRANGFGPWHGDAVVPAGDSLSLEATMPDGAVVEGMVLDANGVGLPNALVASGTCTSLRDSWAHSDAQGAYRLENLPAGMLRLVASHPAWGSVTAERATTAGAALTWDARMPERGVLLGRVFDPDGRPAVSAYLTSTISGPNAQGRVAQATTDATGRFLLAPLDPAQVYDLRVEIKLARGGMVVARRSGIPVNSEVELYTRAEDAPSARLHGRLVHRDGRPAVGYLLLAKPLDHQPSSVVPIRADGSFALGPWPPARLRLLAQHREAAPPLADFGVHELLAEVDVAVGDLVLPATGGLRVRFAGSVVESDSLHLFRDGILLDSRANSLEFSWDELAVGPYTVCARARRGAIALAGAVDAHVRASGVAEAVVTLASATRRRVLLVTDGGRAAGTAMLRATDTSGQSLLIEVVLGSAGKPIDVLIPDAAVTLQVEIDGWRGRAAIGSDVDGLLEVRLERAR